MIEDIHLKLEFGFNLKLTNVVFITSMRHKLISPLGLDHLGFQSTFGNDCLLSIIALGSGVLYNGLYRRCLCHSNE